MVSKIRKTPTRTIKSLRNNRRHQNYGRSPVKTTAVTSSSSVLASINKSLSTCRRRLSKLFSKLVRLGSPNRSKGYRKVKKLPTEEDPFEQLEDSLIKRSPPEEDSFLDLSLHSIRRALPFNNHLPPSISNKRTIFLDLDETLIHSNTDPAPEKFDFVIRPAIDGVEMNFYVLKRPGVDELLEALASKFEIVVFTAGLREYASLVLDRIDKKSLISHRLYRDSCTVVEGKFVKDLSDMGRDLKKVVIVDDNPNSFLYQPENGIPIRPFTNDISDKELRRLIKFFEMSDRFDDMREAVKSYIAEEDQSGLPFVS